MWEGSPSPQHYPLALVPQDGHQEQGEARPLGEGTGQTGQPSRTGLRKPDGSQNWTPAWGGGERRALLPGQQEKSDEGWGEGLGPAAGMDGLGDSNFPAGPPLGPLTSR